ncbi:MAG: hypothetical protein AB7F20_16000 [Geoalkalibacter sp.]|uniref:hypothetical protein n=1 Tax=Geoalkalibacter sp. TaxID=3041440 RepID=UPI003D0BEFD1
MERERLDQRSTALLIVVIGDTRSSGYIYQLYLAQKRVDKTIRTILCAPRHDGYYRFMLGLNGKPDAASV